MRPRPCCWGVSREVAHSPGRESDDAAILQATAAELEARGFDVALRSPAELPETDDGEAVPPFLFVMCEQVATVRRLAAWERQGVRIVNRPEAIRNTDRERTTERLARDGVPYPRSVLVATGSASAPTAFPFPFWVKRGDVHATQAGDVRLVAGPAELAVALAGLADRGIARAVFQEHVPGDLIKLYGVAGPAGAAEGLGWFQWFYHREQVVAGHPFAPGELLATAARGAAALGLDVFGGDAIATPGGRPVLIDLNAWPSFALYRRVAATQIAALLEARFLHPTGALR